MFQRDVKLIDNQEIMENKNKYSLGHKIGKLIVRILDSTVNIAVLVLLLLLFLLGCYSLWDSHIVYSQADSTKYEIYKPSNDEETPSFNDLVAANPETMAWLTINDTGIDYPVAQGTNNEKYVNTDIFGKYSLTGAIFLDYQNKKDFSDFNSIIYGHHMEKDKMFGDLDKYRQENYFNSHKYGNLFHDGRDYGLEAFAYIEGDAYDGSIYQGALTGESSKQEFIDNLYAKATYTFDVGVTTSDHIIILSTCSSDSTNGRYILALKISDTLYPNVKENIGSDGAIHTIDSPGSLLRFIFGLAWWIWLIIVIVFILIIILICWLIGRKRKKS